MGETAVNNGGWTGQESVVESKKGKRATIMFQNKIQLALAKRYHAMFCQNIFILRVFLDI